MSQQQPVKLEPVERHSVSDEVVIRLGEYIVERRLKAGEKLPPERELMQSLRVGRSSLREAIKALRAVGAIDVVAGGGMYVGRGDVGAISKPLSWAVFQNADSMRQAIEARLVLEAELAGFAAERIDDATLAELRSCIERMRASVDRQSFMDADIAFHVGIARAAGNAILSNALGMLHNVMRAWIQSALHKQRGEPMSVEEHEKVYNALARHDRAEATRLMRAHIDAASKRLLERSPE